MKNIPNVLWLILVIILAYFGFTYFHRNNEVTTYPMICKNDGTNCYAGGRTTYKISTDKQDVIFWSDDTPSSGIQKTTKCVILDIDNWSCTYEDGSAKFGFVKGEFYNEADTALSSIFKTYIHYSKTEWDTYHSKK